MLDLLLKFDYWLFALINSTFTFSGIDDFFVWITDLHKTTPFRIIIVPLLFFLFVKKFKRQGVTNFIFLILTLSVCDFTGGKMKHVFERPRPQFNQELNVNLRSGAGGDSFYSNHSANMFAFATYTSYFFPQARAALYTLAFVVAYSRVYNGVHYPSDVFAGALIGIIMALCFLKLLDLLNEMMRKRKASK